MPSCIDFLYVSMWFQYVFLTTLLPKSALQKYSSLIIPISKTMYEKIGKHWLQTANINNEVIDVNLTFFTVEFRLSESEVETVFSEIYSQNTYLLKKALLSRSPYKLARSGGARRRRHTAAAAHSGGSDDRTNFPTILVTNHWFFSKLKLASVINLLRENIF